MEIQLIYFCLGMLAVALIYAVMGVFNLRQQVQHLDHGVDDAYRRIDNNTDELYRALDSRLDKLENRLRANS